MNNGRGGKKKELKRTKRKLHKKVEILPKLGGNKGLSNRFGIGIAIYEIES